MEVPLRSPSAHGHLIATQTPRPRDPVFSINFVRRGRRRKVLEKYRSEAKGRRNFDTTLHYSSLQHHRERKDADRKGGGRYELNTGVRYCL